VNPVLVAAYVEKHGKPTEDRASHGSADDGTAYGPPR
jgi:hypothetical protein